MSTTLAERAKVVPIQLNSHVRVRVCARKHNENRAQVQQKRPLGRSSPPSYPALRGRVSRSERRCALFGRVSGGTRRGGGGSGHVPREVETVAMQGVIGASSGLLGQSNQIRSVGHTGGEPAADGQRRQQRARVEGGCGRGGGRGSLECSKRAPLRCAARLG